MALAEVLSRVAAELAFFAGAGFVLVAVNDLLVDFIYFGRRLWRAATVYSRFPRSSLAISYSEESGVPRALRSRVGRGVGDRLDAKGDARSARL